MRALKLTQSKPTAPPSISARQAAVAAVDADPLARADRLFGAAAHLVLVSDNGPAVSFMGWTLGSSRAESLDDAGKSARVVEIEIMFSENGDYVISERIQTQLADGGERLVAETFEFASPRDVCRHCETSTLDPQSDAARAAAIDHTTRHWPWLKRPGRRANPGEAIKLPFAL